VANSANKREQALRSLTRAWAKPRYHKAIAKACFAAETMAVFVGRPLSAHVHIANQIPGFQYTFFIARAAHRDPKWVRRAFAVIASPEIALSRVAFEAQGVEFDPVPAIADLDAPFDANEGVDFQLIKQLETPDQTRVDWYLEHLRQDRHALPERVRYLVTDGYYAKKKFIDGVVELGLHNIGKLRHDANLRWLYQGPQKPRGRPKLYDGKVNFNDLSRFELIAKQDDTAIYTAVVNLPMSHFPKVCQSGRQAT
jgi:hypothetical protein